MRFYILSIVYVLISGYCLAQELQTGDWRGSIIYDKVEVPFIFTVSITDTNSTLVSIKNGRESIVITDISWRQDSLVIPMHAFDADIIAKVDEHQMKGRWVKYYKSSPGLPFQASFDQPRFGHQTKNKKTLKVPTKLKMTMTPAFGNPYETIGLFEQVGNKVTGTILAEVGDFRYFEGIITKDSIIASSFDGAHAFLFLGSGKNGKWSGELIMDTNYSEPWAGEINNDFELADPFVEIDPLAYEQLEPYFDILTAGSGFNTLNKEDYYGQVTIIQLLGSWCPNSLDETKFLTSWYKTNKELNIDVLAVFYEFNYSKEYGMQRINDYVSQNNIPYSTALGGPANKGQAALAFPMVDKLVAFPTLMILDKQARVRYIHNYFQGPATGSYYDDFDLRFNKIINQLLSE